MGRRRGLGVHDTRVVLGRVQQIQNPLFEAMGRAKMEEDDILALGIADPHVYDAMIRASVLGSQFEISSKKLLADSGLDAYWFAFIRPRNKTPTIADLCVLLHLLRVRFPRLEEVNREVQRLISEASVGCSLFLCDIFRGRSVQAYEVTSDEVRWRGDYPRDTPARSVSSVFPFVVFGTEPA